MKKILFIVLFALTSMNLYAADYYWIGGAGNWSDINHWRLGSTAGAVPSIIPSTADNVFFTSGSGFTSASKTVTLDADGFCNNMTWSSVPNSPIFNTANASFTVEVWGNLIFSPTTNYNVEFDLRGGTANTLTAGGNVSGNFGLSIDKPGGGLTITDSLVCPGTCNISFISGAFNAAGKKMYVTTFLSTSSNARSLDITNSNATVTYQYFYTGTNKTLSATGSQLYALGYLIADSGTYNRVYNDAFGSTNFAVTNTVISYLNFRTANAASYAGVAFGNTIDSLVFAGRGSVGTNNNIGTIIFGMGGTIGDGNIMGNVKANQSFAISGTNTIDSLLLATNYPNTLNGTLNINDYLHLNGQPCDAFTEVSGDSVSGAINFASGAVVDINNMILTGVRAYGALTPIAVTGVDNGGNTGFTITPPAAAGATMYWVGGTGNWNDRTHWSTTSGGAGNACVPFISDDVVFDANSGLATGTVTTSSTSFCHNMTWTGVGNVLFNESATSSFKMYGSLTMDNSVTMNAVIECWGITADNITTNGSNAGTLQFSIQKTGSGSITLTDNWSDSTSGSFIHWSGGLNLTGRTVNIFSYTSLTNAARSVDISNAVLKFADRWDYRGASKTLVSTGAHITAPLLLTDALNYPWVDIAGASVTSSISGTTFGQLTFKDTSLISTASITSGNTIRRLEFKGRGAIGANNIMDTVIFSGSRIYTVSTGNTINKYFQAQAIPCSGLTEIRGAGSIAFASGAITSLANVYMQNMTATGPVTPIAFNGADAGGNSGWTISSAAGSPHYWIGGAGDWNDNAHWSGTSGGASGACIPTVYDDVYFDANSGFTSASKTVTINNGNAYCRNVNWTGAANTPTWSKSASFNLEVWGDSLILNPNATFSISTLTLKGSNATYLRGSAPAGNFDITIDKTGGSLNMLDNYANSSTDITLLNGSFNAPGRTLSINTLDNFSLANTSDVNISNANITASLWRYAGTTTGHSLSAANSVLNVTSFLAGGFTYNLVNVNGTLSTSAQLSNTTIDSLVFTNTSTISTVGINGGANTLNYVEYKGSGGIYGSNNITTLTFFPGDNYTLTAGTNTTITGDWYGSGTPCHLTQIYSSSTTANATVTKTGGSVTFDYARLRRITAAGAGAPFLAREHTDNQGNNTNWNILPYNGAAPIYGLGPDTTIAGFPYTLHTDGFFGSPSSLYTWTGGSTADSLVVVDTGTYSVNVHFVDGCNISDQIKISKLLPLGLTLIDFSAQVQNCQSLLSWKVANVKNFSHFEVESSRDGDKFNRMALVTFTQGQYDYAYTDKTVNNGKTYYRLKLVDVDDRYEYSSVIPIQTNCETQQIKVYPTAAASTLQVALPGGYEQAALRIISTAGVTISPMLQRSGSVTTISIQDLPAGAYLLQVINDKEVHNFNFIKL